MVNLHYGGDIIGDRYQIVTLLGQGGTGKTYSAIDLNNNQKVAIKTVFLSEITDWKTLDLFEREAKVLATLNHPYIPNYLDYFYLDTKTDRRFYLVQELVTGSSLYNLVQNGWHITEEEVKKIAIQILEILNYIHQLSPPVIHRDIKPQNLIRNENGNIYLVDFGAVQDLYRNTLNLTGTIVGTFGYMSPEQFRGKAFLLLIYIV
jgi:serine/threonine protein kinase